jgi:organic radical activating enzyme
MTYPIAPNGIFLTIQGEGALLGLPMIFVRLAGCSVGCPVCDTNYRVSERLTLPQIRDRVSRLHYGTVQWAWITGGEPTDHDLPPLVDALQSLGLRVALATAGTREVQRGFTRCGVDFLSVSPHTSRWQQKSGDQINLVPGLNGLRLTDPELLRALDACESQFSNRYVTPMDQGQGQFVGLEDCIAFAQSRQGWKVGVQAHKLWRLP